MKKAIRLIFCLGYVVGVIVANITRDIHGWTASAVDWALLVMTLAAFFLANWRISVPAERITRAVMKEESARYGALRSVVSVLKNHVARGEAK